MKLREVMLAYTERTGEKLTYQLLAEYTGLSKATVEAIGSRHDYNATLSVVDTLCAYLGCSVSELLEFKKDVTDE